MNKLRKTNYPDVYLLCVCSGSSNTEIISTLRDQNNLHLLSDLHFCHKCSSIRCRRCLDIEIVSKYCPHCKFPMKSDNTHCSRNCFLCPICSIPLLIRSEDETNDQGKLKGKRFKFTCPQDHYQYDTGLIEKPKSLSRILRTQLRSEFNELEYFENLRHHYQTSSEVLKYQEKRATLRASRRSSPIKRGRISDYEVPTISSMDLAKLSVDGALPTFSASIEDLTHDADRVKMKSKVEFLEFANRGFNCLPIEEVVCLEGQKLLPLNQPLKAKLNLACKKCNASILKSDTEPISSKFASDAIAIDVVPDMKFSDFFNREQNQHKFGTFDKRDLNFLISFINPNTSPIEISISSFDNVPIGSDPSGNDDSHAKVNLPCSTFKLGSRPEKISKLESLVLTIPTVELNDSTALSRAELLKRNNVINRLSKPLPNNTNDNPLDTGINWCTIPINIQLLGKYEKEATLRIPFFISVKSSKNDYGFWAVSELGRIDIKE